MTQPQTLQVDREELLARADELVAQIPGPPTENPQAPCVLSMAIRAAQDLALSADNIRIYLGVGEREWQRLAESLRNAAKAYEETDEEAADSLNTSTSVSPVMPDLVDEDLDLPTLNGMRVGATAAEPSPYYSVGQAALQLNYPDQGAAFDRFAEEWTAHQRTLLETTSRFRPFQHWDGEATAAVEAHFDLQRSWSYQMADLCGQLASQAQGVASAQRWAVKEHPTVAQIQELDDAWYRFQQGIWAPGWPEIKQQLQARYAQYQTKSEEVLAEYEKRAALPLVPLNPPKPPDAYKIDPPSEWDPEDWVPDPSNGALSEDDLLDMPEPPAGTPSAGGMPSTPSPDTAALTGALAGAPSLPKGSAGLKPMSFGGGGAGGGVPSMPLQPAADAEAVPRPIRIPPGYAANLGRANPAAGGAMSGGGGMGMAPMGHLGQGQGAGKGKPAQQKGESIYTEHRPWTEALIGNRGAKTPRTASTPGDGRDTAAAS